MAEAAIPTEMAALPKVAFQPESTFGWDSKLASVTFCLESRLLQDGTDQTTHNVEQEIATQTIRTEAR